MLEIYWKSNKNFKLKKSVKFVIIKLRTELKSLIFSDFSTSFHTQTKVKKMSDKAKIDNASKCHSDAIKISLCTYSFIHKQTFNKKKNVRNYISPIKSWIYVSNRHTKFQFF